MKREAKDVMEQEEEEEKKKDNVKALIEMYTMVDKGKEEGEDETYLI